MEKVVLPGMEMTGAVGAETIKDPAAFLPELADDSASHSGSYSKRVADNGNDVNARPWNKAEHVVFQGT